MDKIIEEKKQLIDDLEEINSEVVEATINYKEHQSKLWLETNFEEELGKKRPTVDEKKAYVAYHSLTERKIKEEALFIKEVILKRIELCDDKLKVSNE